MLSKLIGYEFKATRRIFLPAFGVVLLLSLLNGIFIALPEGVMDHISAPFGIVMTVYVFALFAVCVLSLAYMINRFYKNLLGDEGYLMFTLPARPSQLIWSKCIVSTVWMILTTLLCCVSLFVLTVPVLLSGDFDFNWSMFWSQFHISWSAIVQRFGANLFAVPLEVIVLGILWVMNFCLHIYACLSIGGLANRHRLGWSFLAYLAFAVVTEIVLTFGAFCVSKILPDNLFATWSSTAQMHLTLIGFILLTVICMAVNFLITNYLLKKHLNLQ